MESLKCDICKRKIKGPLFYVRYIDNLQHEHILGVDHKCYKILHDKVILFNRKKGFFNKFK